jgi:hypothetical protein
MPTQHQGILTANLELQETSHKPLCTLVMITSGMKRGRMDRAHQAATASPWGVFLAWLRGG